MTNIPVNWKVFECNFSQNPRGAFENLAHILFCCEMNQPNGIFRYFNQPYIETQPVVAADGTLTGYQAKYYDPSTAISSKEQELKEAIKGAAVKYPGIGRILLYVNKELTASSAKDKVKPRYQINIEKCGEDLGIEIVWRVPGNMEQALLALPAVRDLYFNPQHGFSKYIELIQVHGNSILSNIQSDIVYRDQKIKIQQDNKELWTLWNTDKPACIIYGDAGTGKSSAVKDLLHVCRVRDSGPEPFVFSASDLDVEEEPLFLHQYGGYQLEDIFSLYGPDERKICVIDSAEKVYTQRHPQVFRALVRKFIDHGWKIFFTIRTAYKNAFCESFLDGVPYEEFRIDRISGETLAQMGKQYGFRLPEDSKLRDLLRNLFYLKLYLKLDPSSSNTPSSSDLFIRQIWNEVICGAPNRARNMPSRREQLAINIIVSMLKDGTGIYRSRADDDYEALEALEDSGVIASYDDSPGQWMMSHDVYEELIVKHILTDKYRRQVPIEDFRSGFGASLRARKLYRDWLKTLLLQDGKQTTNFFISVIDSSWNQTWKDETLIALMQSESEDASYILEVLLGRETYQLFPRAVFLLDTACRGVNQELLRNLPELTGNKYRLTKPEGPAWFTMFRYIYDNRAIIPWTEQNLKVTVTILMSWTAEYDTGKSTRLAGKIALWLKRKLWKDLDHPGGLQYDSRFIALTGVILRSALELKLELGEIFAVMVSEETLNEDSEDFLILKKSLSNIFDSGKAYLALPQEVLQSAEHYWLRSRRGVYEPYGGVSCIESSFGLSYDIQGNYEPASAYQTPLYPLLRAKPVEAIEFIIQLMNDTTKCYKNSKLAAKHHEISEIELRLPGGMVIRQICSDRLWKMYRGTSDAPKLLASVLMALEQWLLDIAEGASADTVTACCEYLLRKSETAAITAVVLSVAVAYPDKLFEVSCILLKTKEIFLLDISRLMAERNANLFKGFREAHKLYDQERVESNRLPFRRIQFEKILDDYQANPESPDNETYQKRLAKLYAALDEATANMDSWDAVYQYAYYRIDLRKRKVSDIIVTPEMLQVAFEANLPEKLIKNRTEKEASRQQLEKPLPLYFWARARLENHLETANKYPQFENNATSVIEEIEQILTRKDNLNLQDIPAVISASSVLLMDERKKLTEDQAILCEKVVVSYGAHFLDGNNRYQAVDGTDAVIRALASLAAQGGFSVELPDLLFLLLVFVMDGDEEREIAVNSISDILWKSNARAARKLIRAYVALAPRFTQEVRHSKALSKVQFFLQYREEIDDIFQEETPDLNTVSLAGLEIVQLIDFQKMIGPKDESIFDVVLKIGYSIWETILGDCPGDRRKQRKYMVEQTYLQWLGDYILNLPAERQNTLLEYLMPTVKYDQAFCCFLQHIITAEDSTPRYDAFWSLWNLLRNYIFAACGTGRGDHGDLDGELSVKYGRGAVLIEYLLAGNIWNNSKKSWHSLRKDAADFYRLVSHQIGHYGVTLYAVSKVLNTVGKDLFFIDGIEWLSSIIKKNPHLCGMSLPMNTQYYIEEYMHRYVKEYMFTFQADQQRKHMVLDVLDFLVEKGSAAGFFLREEIV